MIRYLVLSLLLFSISITSAQQRWGARDVIRLEDADIYMEITDYQSALKLYLPLYEEYGAVEDMEFKIGYCYFNLNQKEESREYFERANESGNPNASFYLGLYFHGIL